jgi:hypothetical protein
MARNEDITLTPEQARKVAYWEDMFSAYIGETARIEFVKRDGTESVIEGTLIEITGKRSDHRVILVETERGPRSANLWRVTDFETTGPTD